MKLVFTKLETTASEIKVSFDGVNYKPYNVADIKSTGNIPFTEADCPDLTKIKVQGKLVSIGSVEVCVKPDSDDNFIEKEYICGEFYDGGCGYGYRITSLPESLRNKDPYLLYNFCLLTGENLGVLCEYDGLSKPYGYSWEGISKPTGRLYLKESRYSSGGEYFVVPTQYYLK